MAELLARLLPKLRAPIPAVMARPAGFVQQAQASPGVAAVQENFRMGFGTAEIIVIDPAPGDGNGRSVEHLPMLKKIQETGKVVHVGGTCDEIKLMHRELRHDRVVYYT